MASTQFQIYLNAVMKLAFTMTVKFDAVADAINTDLSTNGSGTRTKLYTVDLDPTTWKYYLNLSGQYHESDTVMTVTSLDTLQTIDFTVANLAIHTATAAAYQQGGSYFDDLLARYPTQEAVIRGILHPVDIETAINAKDGTVLWYDTTLVEANEMSLIWEVQEWIQLYQRRWFNDAYTEVANLYLSAHLSSLFTLMVGEILAIRQRKCHTYETHSYHIKQFLASHGALDPYVDYLTKPQQLWLYRNIRYIQRNAGQTDTFQALIDNILTPRGIPLSSWNMRHDVSNLQTNLRPDVFFVREDLNSATADEGTATRDVAQMLAAESNVARGNRSVDQDTIDAVTYEMQLSNNNFLTTKVLESSALDLTDATPYTQASCLLNHWMYYASTGAYLSIVQVTNPTTGEVYALNAADAFVVYMYALSASFGLTLETIPPVTANKVRREQLPTVEQMHAFIDSAYWDDDLLSQVLLNQPAIPRSFLSIESFNTTVNAIHQGELYQHALFSTQGNLWMRAYLEAATFACWKDVPCDFGVGQSYAGWFQSKGLDIPSMSQADLTTLATDLIQTATGADLSTVQSLAAIQEAMLGLMTQLSSYSVQYLASINSNPIIVVERPAIRMGEMNNTGSGDLTVDIPVAELYDMEGSGEGFFDEVFPVNLDAGPYRVDVEAEFHTKLLVELKNTSGTTAVESMLLPRVGIKGLRDNLDRDLTQATSLALSDYELTSVSTLAGQLKSLPEAFHSQQLDLYPVTDDTKATLQARYQAYLEANGTPS